MARSMPVPDEKIVEKIGEFLRRSSKELTAATHFAKRAAISKAVNACAFGLLEMFPASEDVIAFYMEGTVAELRKQMLARIKKARAEKDQDHG